MWDKEVLARGHNRWRYRESGKFIRPKSLAWLQRVLCLAPKLPPLINKLRHDHSGPLIPVCVQLKQSNPATYAQPRVHRACKLTYSLSIRSSTTSYSRRIFDLAVFPSRDSLSHIPATRCKNRSAFDLGNFIERMIDHKDPRPRWRSKEDWHTFEILRRILPIR